MRIFPLKFAKNTLWYRKYLQIARKNSVSQLANSTLISMITFWIVRPLTPARNNTFWTWFRNTRDGHQCKENTKQYVCDGIVLWKFNHRATRKKQAILNPTRHENHETIQRLYENDRSFMPGHLWSRRQTKSNKHISRDSNNNYWSVTLRELERFETANAVTIKFSICRNGNKSPAMQKRKREIRMFALVSRSCLNLR